VVINGVARDIPEVESLATRNHGGLIKGMLIVDYSPKKGGSETRDWVNSNKKGRRPPQRFTSQSFTFLRRVEKLENRTLPQVDAR
jgi:hypothetical protein